MKEHKLQEIYNFTHGDITITVKIDYYNNKISFMDSCGGGVFKKKEWLFADRGVEYMQGWREILEAMNLATQDAQQKYEHQLAITSKFTEDLIIKANKLAKKK